MTNWSDILWLVHESRLFTGVSFSSYRVSLHVEFCARARGVYVCRASLFVVRPPAYLALVRLLELWARYRRALDAFRGQGRRGMARLLRIVARPAGVSRRRPLAVSTE